MSAPDEIFNVLFLCTGNSARSILAEAYLNWPGRPLTAHWGVADPAAVVGTDEQKLAAFMKAFAILQKRIALLASLRLESLDKLATEQHLKQIGKEK